MAEEIKLHWHDGWKTLVTNLLVLLIAILPDFRDYLGTIEGTEVAVAWVVQGLAVANILLRFMTKGPVGQKLSIVTNGLRVLLGRGIK